MPINTNNNMLQMDKIEQLEKKLNKISQLVNDYGEMKIEEEEFFIKIKEILKS